jgi:guanine deaminase
MTHDDYLHIAFENAFSGMRNNQGGPFGAVIVSRGNIIATGYNMVTATNDPTAHAEIVAIRRACIHNNSFDLSGAVLYSTCEPCPMCMSAIYWANIQKVYFSLSRNDAAKIGFNDKPIYEELAKPMDNRSLKMEQLHLPVADDLFSEWSLKQDKTSY